jgi:hypothetical protein
MQAYRLETVVEKDGVLTLNDLPVKAGSSVEVIILVQSPPARSGKVYPLRGKPVTYHDPYDPVAQSDWSVLQ